MQPTSDGRSRGALLGLAVGDALGAPYEFTNPGRRCERPLLEGPAREMKAGGPFNLSAGQTTDDTAMACCLAASLHALGRFDADDVVARYEAWSRVTFDIGNLTSDVLGRVRRGARGADASRAAWEDSRRNSAGNGSLMRCAPIGVFHSDDVDARIAASLDDAAVTHFDPRCRLASAAFNGAIAYAIRTDDATPAAIITATRAESMLAAAGLREMHPDLGDVVDAAQRDLEEDLVAASNASAPFAGASFDVSGGRGDGFVRTAFRLAFWTLVNAPTFEAGLVHVASLGGDSDTNAAITGALLGARFGASAIPPRWCEAVEDALADAPAGPFRDAYHVRVLLALVGG